MTRKDFSFKELHMNNEGNHLRKKWSFIAYYLMEVLEAYHLIHFSVMSNGICMHLLLLYEEGFRSKWVRVLMLTWKNMEPDIVHIEIVWCFYQQNVTHLPEEFNKETIMVKQEELQDAIITNYALEKISKRNCIYTRVTTLWQGQSYQCEQCDWMNYFEIRGKGDNLQCEDC